MGSLSNLCLAIVAEPVLVAAAGEIPRNLAMLGDLEAIDSTAGFVTILGTCVPKPGPKNIVAISKLSLIIFGSCPINSANELDPGIDSKSDG